MMATPRRRTADDVLRSLSALGACVECRGDKIVLRVGARPVPCDLIAAAREAKVELSKMLNTGEGEHLRCAEPENPRFSAAFIEGAQHCESERLRAGPGTFDESGGFRSVRGYPAAEALTEDAHLSTFDKGDDFCGSQLDPTSKALNPAHVSTLEPDEHLHPRWSAAEEERAGIVEHDGKILPAWAESFARLDPEHPSGDVPPRRWLIFVDDVGRFLDSPFCAVAAALGWGPLDLFGCDRYRPFARIDCAGLLWLLGGDKLIALSENTATIERQTGVRQVFRRKPSESGRVLAWELAAPLTYAGSGRRANSKKVMDIDGLT